MNTHFNYLFSLRDASIDKYSRELCALFVKNVQSFAEHFHHHFSPFRFNQVGYLSPVTECSIEC